MNKAKIVLSKMASSLGGALINFFVFVFDRIIGILNLATSIAIAIGLRYLHFAVVPMIDNHDVQIVVQIALVVLFTIRMGVLAIMLFLKSLLLIIFGDEEGGDSDF